MALNPTAYTEHVVRSFLRYQLTAYPFDPPEGLTYQGNDSDDAVAHRAGSRHMKSIESKITSQGQVSVPARIRRKLGLTPGSTVEWCERGDEVVVRRASKYSSLDIHEAVFGAPPARRSVEDMDEGIRSHLRRTHARG